MTEILISIQPKWVEKIMDLSKRWEMRKNRPKQDPPFRCFIYKTEGGGVVGEFVCDDIQYVSQEMLSDQSTIKGFILNEVQLSAEEALAYMDGKAAYIWRIRSLVDYPEPKPLSLYGLDRPPQSWCYVNTQWKKVEGVRVENGQIIIEPKGGDPDATEADGDS